MCRLLPVALSNKAICTTDGAAVTTVMPLTAGRRQRVKFVNYVNFNWPSLPLPLSPFLSPSLYSFYYICNMSKMQFVTRRSRHLHLLSLPLPLPLPYLPASLLKYFAFDCVLCFTSCWRHQLTVPCGMWPLLPAQVCYASSSATHTLALSLSHSLCLSVMRRNVVTCAQQIASAGFEFCGYISVAPSASIFTLG